MLSFATSMAAALVSTFTPFVAAYRRQRAVIDPSKLIPTQPLRCSAIQRIESLHDSPRAASQFATVILAQFAQLVRIQLIFLSNRHATPGKRAK